jgi:alpha-N-acetylglucosaminidase
MRTFLWLIATIQIHRTESDPSNHFIKEWQESRINATDAVVGAKALAARLLGAKAPSLFAFRKLPEQPTAMFSIGFQGEKPLIAGSSGIAITTGFYHYLKSVCNASVSVGGSQLALPNPLPLPAKPIEISSPFQWHWYGSFMANSYTQAFWGWERWEKHLDWCALLGFDIVIVYAGAEYVHGKVYQV